MHRPASGAKERKEIDAPSPADCGTGKVNMERKAEMVEASTDQACLKVPKFESFDSRALSFGVVSREYP